MFPTTVLFVHRREKFDATTMVAFVQRKARGSGDPPPTSIKQLASAAAAMSSTNVSALQTSAVYNLTSAQVGAQAGGRIVARGSEPIARQAERSGKRGRGGGSPHLPSASLPAIASRLKNKPSAAESGVVGAAAPTCDSNPEGGLYSRNHLRVRECHQRAAPQAQP
jgi:hypothetical protein